MKGGKPDCLLMSRRTRRKLKSLLTASAHYVEAGESSFGKQVLHYDGIPVLVSEDMVGHKFGEFSPTRNFHGHTAGDKKAKRGPA